MGYRQLTQTQRYQIHACYDLGISQRQIGRELGLHSSTISRELRRNAAAKWTKHLPSVMAAVGVSHQWIYSLIWDGKARGGDL